MNPTDIEAVIGDPYGNRTHIFAVRGRRLNRLTNGPCLTLHIIAHSFFFCNPFFSFFIKFFQFEQKTNTKRPRLGKYTHNFRHFYVFSSRKMHASSLKGYAFGAIVCVPNKKYFSFFC